MAGSPPNPFAWQSNYNSKYLHLDGTIGGQKGILEFTEEVPKYVFEREGASGYGKIKCSENSLYLKGVQSLTSENSTIWWIVAAAATADEDSTSFQLIKSNNSSFRMIHVKSNLYLRPYEVTGGSNAVLCAVEPKPDPGNVDLFTAIGRP